MKLNIGCGAYAATGWINVDRHQLGRVDVVAPAWELPFADGSADLIYCGHVLEHLTYDDELPRSLAELRRVLAEDGELMVVGPDLDRARARWPREVTNIWPGAQAHGLPGGGHAWPSTVPTTIEALLANGFAATELAISAVDARWPVVSRIGWQFALFCCKREEVPE